jgi:hypothetical protein
MERCRESAAKMSPMSSKISNTVIGNVVLEYDADWRGGRVKQIEK